MAELAAGSFAASFQSILVRARFIGRFQDRARLKPRLGHRRAIVAVAHSLALGIFWVLPKNRTPNPAPIPCPEPRQPN